MVKPLDAPVSVIRAFFRSKIPLLRLETVLELSEAISTQTIMALQELLDPESELKQTMSP